MARLCDGCGGPYDTSDLALLLLPFSGLKLLALLFSSREGRSLPLSLTVFIGTTGGAYLVLLRPNRVFITRFPHVYLVLLCLVLLPV